MHQQVPQLIIFDCDGVLVDSEPISVSVLVDILGRAGSVVSEEEAYLRFLGRSMASVGDILRDDFGFVITPAHLENMRTELARRFSSELKPIKGVAAAMAGLTQARCVASSSGMERIRLSLSLTGLLEMLEPHLYSASMVERGKPAPDLFLHAAHAMGAEPCACLVIEDSPAGVEAARSAGMRVFAFAGGSHAPKAALREALATLQPDALFDDMRELPGMVARLAPGARAS